MEFFTKYEVVQFQVGLRRKEGKRANALIAFIRTDNKDHRYIIDKLITRVEIGFDKLWRQSRPVVGTKEGKEMIDFEISGQTIEREETSKPLPIKIYFN